MSSSPSPLQSSPSPKLLTGKLHLIIGPMFSGKTTNMLNKLGVLYDTGHKVVYLNHNIDNRDPNACYSTHSSILSGSVSSFHMKQTDSDLGTLDWDQIVADYDVVGIDEAQFFGRALLDFVKYLVDNNKYVFVAGLNGDFNKNKFGYVLDLIPKADKVNLLSAFCAKCKTLTKAPFSKRIVEGNTDNILVGGSESYIPVCREHWG